MAEALPARAVTPRVAEELLTAALRVQAAISARQLWERVLTAAERRHFDDDFEAANRKYGTARMWMRLRGVSKVHADLDVAHALNLLDTGTYQGLLGASGEVPDDAAETL